MSIEHALLAQARPHVLAAKARALLGDEITKGCSPKIYQYPIALEPPFCSLANLRELPAMSAGGVCPEMAVTPPTDILLLRIWLTPDYPLDWNRSELFLKQLQRIGHRLIFQITGNADEISLSLACHVQDAPVVMAAFQGEFTPNGLAPCDLPLWPAGSWEDAMFLDLLPPPPYSHLLTRPEEVRYSPYETLMAVMAQLPPPAIGLYQAVFQPVDPGHDYHSNVEILQDIEFAQKLLCGLQLPQRVPQQAPSGDLKLLSGEMAMKAHTDKPFFSLAMRVAVVGAGANAPNMLKALAAFVGLFQHGGRPLQALNDANYRAVLGPSAVRDMFVLGQVHRPGFLVNSWELTGPVHLPPGSLVQDHLLPLPLMMAIPFDATRVASGVQIGACNRAGVEIPIRIPRELRGRSVHIIGAPDMGKSCVMEHMLLQDIRDGAGVAVIDPHGDLVERLLYLIPEKEVSRVTYFNPGNPGWVPLWNPLAREDGQDVGRTADDLIHAFKSIVKGWGDRLEHLLRQALYAVLHIRDSSLLDVVNLLRSNSDESVRLREAFMPLLEHDLARSFWKYDFEHYTKQDIAPVHHKLSKILMSEPLFLMLSQPENRISFRDIMDNQGILLANLSNIGPDETDVLGGFVLGLFRTAALARSTTPAAQRRAFYLYCDEAHRFASEGIEKLLAELRKFGLGVTLSHHFTKQFSEAEADALSETGSTLIFKVDGRDGRFLTKDLMGKVAPEVLTTLEKGEAIARIGPEVVRLQTMGPLLVPEKHFRDRIIAESQQRYCLPVAEVRKRTRHGRGNAPLVFPSLAAAGEEEASSYDEF